jgi:hypothetical protein
MWSKKPTPVAISAWPVPSRLMRAWMEVSAVLRVISAWRGKAFDVDVALGVYCAVELCLDTARDGLRLGNHFVAAGLEQISFDCVGQESTDGHDGDERKAE